MAQKSTTGILRLGGDIIGTDFGVGVITERIPQRTAQRVTASGRRGERPLGLFSPVLETTLADNAKTASKFGWFDGNGRTMEVDWRPAGDGSGNPQITFTGLVTIDGAFAAERIRRLRIAATGGFVEASQS